MEAAPEPAAPPDSDPGPLPGDPAEVRRLLDRQRALIDEQRRTITELAGQRRALELRVADLLRRLYGRRSCCSAAVPLKPPRPRHRRRTGRRRGRGGSPPAGRAGPTAAARCRTTCRAAAPSTPWTRGT